MITFRQMSVEGIRGPSKNQSKTYTYTDTSDVRIYRIINVFADRRSERLPKRNVSWVSTYDQADQGLLLKWHLSRLFQWHKMLRPSRDRT